MTKRRILTLNPLKARAAYHRACAIAALYANSSLATRLKRYQHHIRRARTLEQWADLVLTLRAGGGQ